MCLLEHFHDFSMVLVELCARECLLTMFFVYFRVFETQFFDVLNDGKEFRVLLLDDLVIVESEMNRIASHFLELLREVLIH